MALRRYVPSGHATPRAIAAVLVAAVVGGVVVGVIEGFLARWIIAFLLYPAAIAAFAGYAAKRAIQRCKLRAPAIALVLGFLGGFAGYAAEHVTAYLDFRHAHPEAPGFVEFHRQIARRGVTIKADDDPQGLRLVGTEAWLLWLAELLFSAIAAGVIAYRRASEPFCDNCQSWFAREVTVQANGAGTPAMRAQMMAALERGDVDAAAAAFFGPRPPKFPRRFDLTVRVCPRGGRGAGYFQLYRRHVRQRGRWRLAHWMMKEADRERFTAALAQAMATRPAM